MPNANTHTCSDLQYLYIHNITRSRTACEPLGSDSGMWNILLCLTPVLAKGDSHA